MTERTLTMLRTAAGSPPWVTQCKAFQALGCRIVAADSESSSVGFHFADAAYVVPRAKDAGYIDRILEICERESVDIFLPALDEELESCARHRDRFEAIGTMLLVSNPSALAICTDKLRTYDFYRNLGIPTPSTVAAEDYRVECFDRYPLIIKPRAGRGSTGVYSAKSHEETVFFCSYVVDAVVQECLTGMEYTIDVLAGVDSEVLILSARKRLATDSGISSKGVTDWRNDFVAPIKNMVKALRLVGPLNVQCFVSLEGRISFTEINARLAGTSILTQASGVPYFEGILALARGERPDPWIKPSAPLIMYRYWNEFYQRPGE
jgi:carbamoyl-phosphate synthase large subunit